MELLKTIWSVLSVAIHFVFRSFDWNFDGLFLYVWDASICATLVILIVLFLRLILRKAPKVCAYVLWAVVFVRLLCPVGIDVKWGIIPSVDTAETYTLANDDISFIGAADAAVRAVGDAANGGLDIQHVRTKDHSVVSSYWWEIWFLFGKYVWAAGVAAMGLRTGISYAKLKKHLHFSVPVTSEHWSDSAVMPQKTNLFMADGISTAFVIGVFSPRIYLPSDLSEEEQGYILLHEQHHIKRGDHIWKMFGFAALCIHWFNPFVWLAFRTACKDMEMSCDEAVVVHLDSDTRKAYAASLLRLSTGNRMASISLAFGGGETCDRVRHVIRYKKPLLWSVVLAVIISILSSVVLFTNRTSNSAALAAMYQSDLIVYSIEGIGGRIDSGPQFCVTGDLQLYRRNAGETEWTHFGQMEPYTLTKKELKQYTAVDQAWVTSYRLHEITESYMLRMENDLFYLLFRMKNGQTLMGFGWEDTGERWQGYSDDTSLRVLYRLSPQEAASGVMYMTMQSLVGDQLVCFEERHIGSYVIYAFGTGAENQHWGYALFKESRSSLLQEYADSVQLLEWHLYENAGLDTLYGIYLCPDPVVLSENGTMTNQNTYDVILNQYKGLDRVVQTVKVDGKIHHTVEQSELDGRSLILLNWDDTDAENPSSVSLQFYDNAGYEIGYGSLSQEERILRVFADDPDFNGYEPEYWVLAEDGAYGLQGVILFKGHAGRIQFVFVCEDHCYPVAFGENRELVTFDGTDFTYLGGGTVQASFLRDGEIITMQISFSKTETGIHYKAEDIVS